MTNQIGSLNIKLKKNKKGNLPKNDISIVSNGQTYKMETLALDTTEATKYSLALLDKIFGLSEEGKFSWNIEFKIENGKPICIYEKGTKWDREEIQDQTFANRMPTGINEETPKNVNPNNFHNPYNFVPALPRDGVTGELGDHPPAGHSYYHGDKYSGRISVKLKTVTPLLIPDASLEEEDGNKHKTYPVRIGSDGKPYLPSTSIKGMLRTAYEAVTNSRLAVFEKHDSRLAYRMPATEGTKAKPARVEKRKDGLYLRILNDSSCIGGAAKLPRYEKNGRSPDKGENRIALRYDGTKELPKHGDRVQVLLSKGKVIQIQKCEENQIPTAEWKLGWVCVTGANIGGKQNERVFLHDPSSEPIKIKINNNIKELWENLIADYQATHVKDLAERKGKPDAYLGHKPGETAWSRHVYDKNQLELQEGILCYAELKEDEVIALQPVTISRRLYEERPADLLPKSLHPAQSKEELSPADRIFGWVRQGGNDSYKGQLRIHSITCQTSDKDPIEKFSGKGVPLAILGQPKPAQTHFYTAENKIGEPIKAGKNKEYGYEDKKRGLRGRKIYPHHTNLPDNYWQNPTEYKADAYTNGYCQEYRRPSGADERDSQNRSITGWVKQDIEFYFEIDVINLSSIELGALLWLLRLPDQNACYRLGGGKPLGFGSVRLNIDWDRTDLRSGLAWKSYYSSLSDVVNEQLKFDYLIDEYQKAMEMSYGNGQKFTSINFIKSFLQAAKGFNDNSPIHYPRLTKNPDKEGKNFEWFTDNESGDRWSLPNLASGESLPLKPRTTQKKEQGKNSPSTGKVFQRAQPNKNTKNHK